MIKLSIIIPVYNVVPYLRRCLDSMSPLNTLNAEVEVLTINDGSTDESGEILEEYAKKFTFIRVFAHLENRGVSAARNTGLHQATGEWVMFVDPDDWLSPGAILKILDLLDELECDVFLFDSVFEDEKTGFSIQSKNYVNGSFDFENRSELRSFFIRYGLFGTVWGALFSRRVLSKVDFSPFTHGEDTLFLWSVLNRARKVQTYAETWYHYWVREGSADKTQSLKRTLSTFQVWRAMLIDLAGCGRLPLLYDLVDAKLHLYLFFWAPALLYPLKRCERGIAWMHWFNLLKFVYLDGLLNVSLRRRWLYKTIISARSRILAGCVTLCIYPKFVFSRILESFNFGKILLVHYRLLRTRA